MPGHLQIDTMRVSTVARYAGQTILDVPNDGNFHNIVVQRDGWYLDGTLQCGPPGPMAREAIEAMMPTARKAVMTSPSGGFMLPDGREYGKDEASIAQLVKDIGQMKW